MKKILFGLALSMMTLSCAEQANINNTSWVTDQGNMTIVMSFKSPNVQIQIKEGDKNVGETTGTYSIVGDTIRIGNVNNYDKAVIENGELIYIEGGGITKFKKLKQ